MYKVTHYFPYNQIYLRKKHTKKHHCLALKNVVFYSTFFRARHFEMEISCQNQSVPFRVLWGLNICKSAIFFVPLQQQINRKPSTRPITGKEASIVSGSGFKPNQSEMLKIAVDGEREN